MKIGKFAIKNIFVVTTVVSAAISLAACNNSGSAAITSDTQKEAAKAVKVEVVDSKGTSKSYEEKTNADTLREVMDQLKEGGDFTYEGSDSGYGLYIESINGERADYNADKAYWSIYVNGEYGQNGADTQTVTDGDVFRFVYEKQAG